MNWHERREKFRKLLDGDRCITLAAVFDPVSARIAEGLGFETGILPGSLASFAILAAPDLTLITLSELAEQTLRICRASKLPLLVDADHGYGNALNVARSVNELEIAGAAALTIEDTLLPAPFGAADQMRLVSVGEVVGKLHAAMGARSDRKLAIVGRTNAAAVTDIEELVQRSKAYEATGIDALFLAGITGSRQLDAVSSAISIPIVLGLAPSDLSDRALLAARRVRMNHVGSHGFGASIQAIQAAMQAVREGNLPPERETAAAGQLAEVIMQSAKYAKSKRTFLS